ncbi:uncharacterized protein EV420DRAFT_1482112 [Desarmillaria tabescens]|uniref:Uncharacterized protein n=1 Tax=Armillaria tabescens TaxID=1929756 RepID=A0AA39K5W0_ARMTA|nr:uncharacterized protein EV420DRAFT_1482112 [Desarmillaria tabescens]KAK0452818.1 hypothetical protein EV420DRAFT_1482112 [Desarmillaria tabescens]
MLLVAVSDCGGRRVSDSPFYNVLRDPSKRPSMGDDPLPWLIELRDIVIRMDDKSLPHIRHELGDNRWCQLIYLNIRKTDARTLVKTKVGKVDVSDWDLLPQETGISVRPQ